MYSWSLTPFFSKSRNLGFRILDDFSTYCENWLLHPKCIYATDIIIIYPYNRDISLKQCYI